MPYGYHGKILHLNLDHGEFQVEEPPTSFYRENLGGSALALYYILHNTPAGVDAIDPRNCLVFASSVITGAPIAGLSRLTVAAKSPLTGGIGDSQCGGFFPVEFKFAGFDALVVTGRAAAPSYLWIKDGNYELRPAGQLWGRTTGEVQNLLRDELGDQKIEVLQTGIAGENGVRFAALMNNANRANGRTGMGPVMASKNLKAIAVRGTRRPELADPTGVHRLAKWGTEHLKEKDVYMLSQSGTAGGIAWSSDTGGLSTRNWSSGTFEKARAIDGDTINQKILKERDSCYACNIRCKPVVEILDGPYPVDPTYGGPEYETLYSFGSSCGIEDLSAVAYANQLCNMYGMDTISCGATIAWAMDCFEHGLITEADTGGLDLHFGNAAVMVELVERIAHRSGFGDLLAEGSARAAERLGRGTQELVVAVKKQELPAHMPTTKPGLGVIYAVNPFGADHQSNEHDPAYGFYPDRSKQLGLEQPQAEFALNREVVRYAFVTQCLYSCLDSLNICQFVFGAGWQIFDPAQLVDLVHMVTGWDVSMGELLRQGEKRLNLMRAFNMREGIDGSADGLPKKLMQPLVGGKSEGRCVDAEQMEAALRFYYQLAGWDEQRGIPGRAKLEALDLGWVWELVKAENSPGS
jgi:aldehyde:ferredoxin oxidoreductase